MNRLQLLFAGLLLFIPLAGGAAPIVFNDPFPGTAGSSASYDVIGDRTLFDIDKAVVDISGSAVSVSLGFRYKDTTTPLQPYNYLANYSYYGINLGVGDLFFEVGGQYKYGVALRAHDGLAAGDLYAIVDATGTRTAREALGNPAGAVYRYDEIVRMGAAGVAFEADGSIDSITTSGLRSASGGIYHMVSWSLPLAPEQFIDDLYGSTLHFASATCGNDVLDGKIPARVPEPATLFLFGAGLVTMAATLRRKP